MNTYIKVENTDNIDIRSIVSDDSPSFSGIVSGISKGEIYLDQQENPKVGIIYSEPVGGFSILGRLDTEEETNQCKEFLEEVLFPEIIRSKGEYFEFSTTEQSVLNKMLSMFSNRDLQTEMEYSFRMSDKPFKDCSIPDGYDIVPIDHQLVNEMEQRKIENASLALDIIHDSWFQVEDYLRLSLGFAAIYKNKIVGTIIGTSRFHQFVPIDIVTEEDHRKLGLASAMTNAFIMECQNRGLTAHWDCVESNLASLKTAKKCGFELLRQRNYYWFKI